MSANNFILIQEFYDDMNLEKGFRIQHRDADTGYIMNDLGVKRELRQAIKVAKEFEKGLIENGLEIEYGFDIRLLEEEK